MVGILCFAKYLPGAGPGVPYDGLVGPKNVVAIGEPAPPAPLELFPTGVLCPAAPAPPPPADAESETAGPGY